MPTDSHIPTIPTSFWNTPSLQRIKLASFSAVVAPDAVLHAVLARLAAFTPSDLLLPGIVGGPAPLNYFAAILARSGGGKSTAAKVAARLVPAPDILLGRDDIQIGTGEGLVESFLEKDESGEKVQVHHNAYVYVDEGEILRRYGSRDGTTLDVIIRSAFSGSTLGQTNASKATSRRLEANSYSIGLVAGFQPAKAGALLTPESIDGGTPQRFVWASGSMSSDDDHWIDSHDDVEWPGPLKLNTSVWTRGGLVKIAPVTARAIRDAHRAVNAGRETLPPLDAHEPLITLRMAALMALLHGRFNPIPDDHHRARILWRTNQQVRRWVQQEVDDADQDDLNRQIRREMQRSQAQVIARERAGDVAERIRGQVLRSLERHDGQATFGVLKADITKRLHPYFEDALVDIARDRLIVLHKEGGTMRISLPSYDEIVLDLNEPVG